MMNKLIICIIIIINLMRICHGNGIMRDMRISLQSEMLSKLSATKEVFMTGVYDVEQDTIPKRGFSVKDPTIYAESIGDNTIHAARGVLDVMLHLSETVYHPDRPKLVDGSIGGVCDPLSSQIIRHIEETYGFTPNNNFLNSLVDCYADHDECGVKDLRRQFDSIHAATKDTFDRLNRYRDRNAECNKFREPKACVYGFYNNPRNRIHGRGRRRYSDKPDLWIIAVRGSTGQKVPPHWDWCEDISMYSNGRDSYRSQASDKLRTCVSYMRDQRDTALSEGNLRVSHDGIQQCPLRHSFRLYSHIRRRRHLPTPQSYGSIPYTGYLCQLLRRLSPMVTAYADNTDEIPLIFTGHSLGGGLAMSLSIYFKDVLQFSNAHAITYSGVGAVDHAIRGKYATPNSFNNPQIVNYANGFDVVPWGDIQPGNICYFVTGTAQSGGHPMSVVVPNAHSSRVVSNTYCESPCANWQERVLKELPPRPSKEDVSQLLGDNCVGVTEEVTPNLPFHVEYNFNCPQLSNGNSQRRKQKVVFVVNGACVQQVPIVTSNIFEVTDDVGSVLIGDYSQFRDFNEFYPFEFSHGEHCACVATSISQTEEMDLHEDMSFSLLLGLSSGTSQVYETSMDPTTTVCSSFTVVQDPAPKSYGKFNYAIDFATYAGTGIANGAASATSAVGRRVVNGASAVGSGVARGASAAGRGITWGASVIGSGVARGASAVGSGIADGASNLASTLSNAIFARTELQIDSGSGSASMLEYYGLTMSQSSPNIRSKNLQRRHSRHRLRSNRPLSRSKSVPYKRVKSSKRTTTKVKEIFRSSASTSYYNNNNVAPSYSYNHQYNNNNNNNNNVAPSYSYNHQYNYNNNNVAPSYSYHRKDKSQKERKPLKYGCTMAPPINPPFILPSAKLSKEVKRRKSKLTKRHLNKPYKAKDAREFRSKWKFHEKDYKGLKTKDGNKVNPEMLMKNYCQAVADVQQHDELAKKRKRYKLLPPEPCIKKYKRFFQRATV